MGEWGMSYAHFEYSESRKALYKSLTFAIYQETARGRYKHSEIVKVKWTIKIQGGSYHVFREKQILGLLNNTIVVLMIEQL